MSTRTIVHDGKVQCFSCREWKALNDENFHRHPSSSTGYSGTCKPCRREYWRTQTRRTLTGTQIIDGEPMPNDQRVFHPRELHVRDPEPYPEDVERPRTRADCVDVPRPCPFVSCRHNMYLQVFPKSHRRAGCIQMNFPHLAPWDMDPEASCALDIAERGGVEQIEIGGWLNLTRERTRQLCECMFRKLERNRDLREYRPETNDSRRRLQVAA